MVRKCPLRANGEKKLVQRFAETISDFDDFDFQLKGFVWDINKYMKVKSNFPFSDIGFVLYDEVKQAAFVEIHKSFKKVYKILAKENELCGELMLQFTKKLEIKGHGFDTCITISEGN